MGMELEFFADDDELEKLEMQLAVAGRPPTVELLLPLAWQMRQRNSTRALTLIDEVEHTLRAAGHAATEQSLTIARLQLIRAEVHWLRGELDLAQSPLEAAQVSFASLGDSIGMGDCELLFAYLWSGRGELAKRKVCLELAQDHYAAGGDSVRLVVTQARVVFYTAFVDPVAAREHWQMLGTTELPEHLLVRAWMFAVEGVIENLSGNFGVAARALLRAYEAMRRCGDLMLAANCAANAGGAFSHLNDLAASMQWSEQALVLARQIGNKAQIAVSCANIANALRRLQRTSDASARLQEAHEALADLPTHPFHANVLDALAELALETGDHAVALAWSEQGEALAIAALQRESQTHALRQQARALGYLGRAQEALVKAEASWTLGIDSGNGVWQIQALGVLAELHRHHQLPAPQGMAAPNAVLHYLQQALTLGRNIEGYELPPDLLAQAAADYAAADDHVQAYALSLEAHQALLQLHSKAADDRAIALQVRQEIDTLQKDTEQHRQQRRDDASRALALQQTNAVLQELGTIGREITGHLDAQLVFSTLYINVQGMMDAFGFALFFVDAAGENLSLVYGIEDEQTLQPFTAPLNPHRLSARCIREQRVIVEEVVPSQGAKASDQAGTLSKMCAPLTVGERVLGVMLIWSLEARAYGEREVAIFQSLSAYGAIALANAETFAALEQAQAQMVQQEKMASLGQLVANVAHEINTPVSAIQSSGQSIAQALEQALRELPELLGNLPIAEAGPFRHLLSLMQRPVVSLSSRQERAITRELVAQLDAMGVQDAHQHAGILVQCRVIASDLNTLAPVLYSARVSEMLGAAYNLAVTLNNAANINAAAQSVSRIVFALKSLARQDNTTQAVDTDLRESLNTVLILYESKIRIGTELVKNYDEVPIFQGYPDELGQVWANLIHNALQAMNHKGVLTVSLRQENGHAVVAIGDSGCGIPPEIQGRIFEAFFTTKPTGEGRGLGLDIVKKIVDKHAGRMEVLSEVGKGSTFTVYLPYITALTPALTPDHTAVLAT